MTLDAISQARNSYNIDHWGAGYFDIDEQGQLIVYPDTDRNRSGIVLNDVINDLHKEGLALPVLLRFEDILRHRAGSLVTAFQKMIAKERYQGEYTAVYPIKVNQEKKVVETLINHPGGHIGLEAGSKPELLAILGIAQHPIKIVCNGYKDSEFLRLALIGEKMGHQVHIVVEKVSELDKLLTAAEELNVSPRIGIRVKLNSVASGKWQNTGGEKGKFGLSASQVLAIVGKLRERNALDCLCLLHCHIGSQVANIRDVQRAMKEVARYYAELRAMGVPLSIVDVGGGLGVDYEGSQSRSSCSMNYSIEDYASRVVHALVEVCEEHELPQPNIVSESGRAMTAHHAVLIVNTIDIEPSPGVVPCEPPVEEDPWVLFDLWQTLQDVGKRRALEVYHDAVYHFGEAHTQFVQGMISVTDWARAEQFYFNICHHVRENLSPRARSHQAALDELNEKLASKLFCNFSLFQSLPDVWGINQLFPIMPLSYLNKPLTERGILQDITCDSDGQITAYVDGEGVESSLPLPKMPDNGEFCLGMFMVGAYQEILGDMHNLFGDTHSANIKLTDTGYTIENIYEGDDASEVLRYVHYEPNKIKATYRRRLAAALGDSSHWQGLFDELMAGIAGYTYFEDSADGY